MTWAKSHNWQEAELKSTVVCAASLLSVSPIHFPPGGQSFSISTLMTIKIFWEKKIGLKLLFCFFAQEVALGPEGK